MTAPAAQAAAPRRAAPAPRRIAAQARFETRLLLRNGEQLLLTVVIPTVLLVALSTLPLLGDGDVDSALPAVLAIAVMSSGFTSTAISTGFERRYDVLRWFGATPLSRSGLLAGKTASVILVVAMQTVLLLAVALVLGWRFDGSVPALMGALLLGAACFTALGLLLGGVLRAEVTLAAANLIWFVLVIGGGTIIAVDRLPATVQPLVSALPSAALTEAVGAALSGGWDSAAVGVLLAWGVGAALAASRWFRWS